MDDDRRSWRMGVCADTGEIKRWITIQIIVDVILWLMVGLPVLYLFLFGSPTDRGFFCDDVSISYPYKPDTVSTNMLLVLGFSTSLIVVLIVEVLNSVNRHCYDKSSPPDSITYIIKCYVIFLVGFNINQLFVEIIKNETGALRPNFLDVCRPQYNSSLCPGYISEYRCSRTHTAETIRRSRQSFPSGHSAFTMYIAVYFCLYIYHRLRIKFSRVLKVLLQTVMLLVSMVCGFHRIIDHKHHMVDVISGFAIGAFSATFMYKTLAERIMMVNEQEKKPRCTVQCGTCYSSRTDPANPTPLLSTEYSNDIDNIFMKLTSLHSSQ